MKIALVIKPELRHQAEWGALMLAGLKRHGLDVSRETDPRNATGDVAICWGWTVGRVLREAGMETLVMERGYLGDRREWTSLGWNGLNGRAAMKKETVGTARWEANFAQYLKPWRTGGDYSLVMGQVRGDAALAGVDIHAWYGLAVPNLAAEWHLPVRYRPHPMDETPVPDGASLIVGPLLEALSAAAVVATYNSSSGVDAVLAGVPTISTDPGSMVWDVSAHDFDHRATPDRTDWANRLAWRQWRREEIESGDAWDFVKDAA